jgi:hypothetical protein
MPAPRQLVRNLRHPAHNGNDCFDDHEITFLASLYLQLQVVYATQPRKVSHACFEIFQDVRGRRLGLGVANYDKTKLECHQPFRLPGKKDIEDLFRYFSELDPVLLRPWCDVVAEAALGKATNGAVPEGAIIVYPLISKCLFCPDMKLDLSIRRASGKGAAKGGHVWAYDYIKGGQVAVLFRSTCSNCLTDYSLQTYTPGDPILQEMGMTLTLVLIATGPSVCSPSSRWIISPQLLSNVCRSAERYSKKHSASKAPTAYRMVPVKHQDDLQLQRLHRMALREDA